MPKRPKGPFVPILAGVAVVVAACVSQALAIPAFPGAEGYGGNSVGGRNGDVYHVTSLADTSTVGTLRYGLSNAPAGGRTIVFDTSGTIALTSTLSVSKSNITIAGQTAPGKGICLTGNYFEVKANNLIIRDMHIRYARTGAGDPNVDSVTISAGSNIILDHLSTSWSTDEVLSVKEGATATTLTVQNCFITEALTPSGLPDHNYGSLIRPTVNAWYSFYNNLYADNRSRNPRPGYENNSNATVTFDFRNNVIYNWSDQAGYTANDGAGCLKMNYVGNYAIQGPSGTKKYIFNGASDPSTQLQIYQPGSASLYANKMDANANGILDGNTGSSNGWSLFTGVLDGSKMTSEFPMGSGYPAVVTMTADDALLAVLNRGGALSWNRDSLDANVVSQVLSYGTAGSIYNTVAEAGGWPSYPSGTVPTDTDQDGMPDTWEIAHGLDPSVASNNGDYDADGYTNLEEYLNELESIPAPKIITWADAGGSTAGRYEVITNWDIPWQPSLTDQVQINSGKATVAYIGQQAGTIYVGNTASSNGELAVTGGSLALANRLILGNATSARGTATLSGGSLTAGKAIILASAASSTGLLKVSKGAYVQVGGLTINTGSGRSSTVGVEVASDGCSLIRTTATSTLGGVMDTQSLSGFRPKEGDKFTVIASSDPSGVHFTGNFTSFTSNILLGLPGSSAFGGAASGSNYQLTFLGYTYGDANGDHKVDGGDLSLMGGAWSQSGKAWATCDFTGEGVVDGGDLALMGGNWNWSLPGGRPLSIPEPGTLVLLAVGAAGLVRRRR